MTMSPLQQVKDRFGSDKGDDPRAARQAAKEALIKAVRGYAKKGDILEDDFSDKGIERLSNSKLLKLHDLAQKVETDFGSRSGLVDKVLELENRTKDAGFREHVEAYGLPRLFDRFTAATTRAKKTSK